MPLLLAFPYKEADNMILNLDFAIQYLAISYTSANTSIETWVKYYSGSFDLVFIRQKPSYINSSL